MVFMHVLSQKHKNPKEMSSPKRKAYFKSFLKLWNKRKLPQVKDQLNGNLIHTQDFCYFFTWSHHSYIYNMYKYWSFNLYHKTVC